MAIHRKLIDWANDDAQELTTLWLNGMAGTGKTAVASTFASNMEDQGTLGATFFIDRQQAERRKPSRIVQTLAYDLAKHNYKQLIAVWTALRAHPKFEHLSYQEQARLLIKGPLDIGRPETLVVVIDGLDECGASEGASLLATLVMSLAHHPIKLFVTSRNEANIIDTFRDLPHTSYKLQDVDVSGDVQLYWEHSLDELCRRKHLPDWRSMVALDELVELTGDLFIYATSILKIIQNTRANPINKLRDLLEMSRSGSGSAMVFVGPGTYSPLEKLYIHILSEAMKDHDGSISAEYADYLHDILEVIIFAREPLPLQAFSQLLDMDINDLDAYLSPMCSVLELPHASQADDMIRPLHQSFLDFVRQQGHVVHPALTMHAHLAHKNIAERCFRQVSKLLHYNIYGIQDSSLFNLEIPDLWTKQKEQISAALRYSCRYGLTHLLEHIRVAGSESQVHLGLDTFLTEHLLHWIELLSLTGDLDEAKKPLSELITFTSVRILTI
jgi:hypothetical protein